MHMRLQAALIDIARLGMAVGCVVITSFSVRCMNNIAITVITLRMRMFCQILRAINTSAGMVVFSKPALFGITAAIVAIVIRMAMFFLLTCTTRIPT